MSNVGCDCVCVLFVVPQDSINTMCCKWYLEWVGPTTSDVSDFGNDWFV